MTNHNGIVACAERAAKPWVVKPQCLLRGLANASPSDDEEVVVDEDEMLRPPIPARIEEAIGSTARPMRDLLPLAQIAEGATPREVVEMLWTASADDRSHGPKVAGDVICPQHGRDDVVDLKWAGGR